MSKKVTIVQLPDPNSEIKKTLDNLHKASAEVMRIAPELMSESKHLSANQSKAMHRAWIKSLSDKPSSPVPF